MGANGQPGSTAGEPPEEVQRLLPVLARVFDLGRGPPGLVWWVRRQLAASGAPTGRPAARTEKRYCCASPATCPGSCSRPS